MLLGEVVEFLGFVYCRVQMLLKDLVYSDFYSPKLDVLQIQCKEFQRIGDGNDRVGGSKRQKPAT